MRDQMKFVNHVGDIINFGKGNILINENDFRDFEWNYNSQYKKITTFNKNIIPKSLPVIVAGNDYRAAANTLFETLEKDVLAEKPGKMFIGNCYLQGYFYASKKSGYTKQNSIEIELNFVADQKFWISESVYIYRISDTIGSNDRGLGYSYGYPYDFQSSINVQELRNTSFANSNLIITIYGPVSSPSVTIAGNTYKVNTEILSNEYLTINTLDKTIMRTTAKGVKVNEFANRDSSGGYIFQKIPSGVNSVAALPDCNFDIIVLEERSEPKWI